MGSTKKARFALHSIIFYLDSCPGLFDSLFNALEIEACPLWLVETISVTAWAPWATLPDPLQVNIWEPGLQDSLAVQPTRLQHFALSFISALVSRNYAVCLLNLERLPGFFWALPPRTLAVASGITGLTLFVPFSQRSLSCTASCPVSENHCFTYFVWLFLLFKINLVSVNLS